MDRSRIDPLLHEARRALGAGALAQARTICEQANELDPRNIDALGLLGQVHLRLGHFEQSASYLYTCVRLAPKDFRGHLALGEVLVFQGRYRDAVARYDRVLRLRPDDPMGIAGKANAYEKSGQRDKARGVLRPFVDSGRESVQMALIQANLDLQERNYQAVIDLLNRHMTRGPDAVTLYHLCAVLGSALERSGRYDEAFEAYRRSNRSIPAPFSPEAWRARIDDLIEVFSAEHMAALPRSTIDSEVPVFIVGMPRSGSTLIETILDAHPQAFGAGEFTAVPALIDDMSLRIGSNLPYPQCVEDLSGDDLDALATTYLRQLTAVSGKSERIADKYLENYRHLGLIDLLLPQARVIHCRRHPLDTCLSCFAQPLPAATHPYVLDLQRLATVYVQYERLMDHWHNVLRIPVLDVQYEELVSDQERVSREIVEFCGLPWDDRCLKYHQKRRVVQTSSYDQVTRPIYGSSVGRHRNFEAQLAPLKEALVAAGVGVEATSTKARRHEGT